MQRPLFDEFYMSAWLPRRGRGGLPAGDFHDLSGLITHIGLGSLAMRLCMCFPELGGKAHAKYGK